MSTKCNNQYEFEKLQRELLFKHKVKIEEMLDLHKENTRVWDKYVWIANYHNYFCSINFANERELKISKKSLLSWPRSISRNDT